MAKIRVLNTKQATHNAAQVDGLREVSFNLDASEKEFASDGGPTEAEATDFKVTGEAVFEDVQAYNTVLGNDESDLVLLGVTEGGGTDRQFTAKNCKFIGTRISLTRRQDRDVGTYRCQLRCTPGASDGPEDMIAEVAAS